MKTVETTDYRQLVVWQKSIDFIDLIYDATETFPDKERFGLCSQMQRAGVSIASNIAEGSARHSRRDFVRFLRQARGSAAEVETQITVAVRRNYISRELGKQLFVKSMEIRRMINGLSNSLNAKSESESRPEPSMH